MADVPHLALDVGFAAVHALAEVVVEPAEVAAALAVHPAEVRERVRPLDALGVGQPERAALHPPPAVVELELVLDADDRHRAVGEEDGALARRGTSARVGEVEPAVAVGAEQHPLADAGTRRGGRGAP